MKMDDVILAKDVDLGHRFSARLTKTRTETVSVLELASKLPTSN